MVGTSKPGSRRYERAASTRDGVLFNVAAVVVPAVLLAASGWWSWRSIEREAIERAGRAAAAAAEHARRVLETQDTLLEAALSRVRDMEPAAIAADKSVYDFLVRLERNTFSSSATSLTDVINGSILSSSASFPPPAADLSGRDYVQHFRSAATGTYIGGIVRGAASGRLGFTVSRRDGQSAVAAVTLVPLDNISAFYRTLREYPGDTLTLARSDGAALVIPAVADPVAYVLPQNAVLLRLLRGEVQAPLRAVSAVDGVDRLWTHAKVGDYPVHVIYGRDASTMWQAWLSRITPLAVLATFGSALLLVAGFRAQRALAARELAEMETNWARSRAQHAEALQESEARFRVLFDELPLPAWLIDPASLRILDCNQRAADVLGYTRDQLRTMRVPDFEAALDTAAIADNERAIAREGRLTLETRHRTARGEVLDMLITANSIRLGGSVLTFASGIEITERKRAETHIRLLMQEVNHRAKNMMGVVQAIARNTARAGDPATFMERLSDRIRGLAACQDLLVNGSWSGIDLDSLIRSQLAHFADLIGSRITLEGPPLRISAAAAQAIGMAIHELATNAGKYGSLSTDDGKVAIEWKIAGQELSLQWCERDGPPVRPSQRRGFGHTVIETMAAGAVKGKASLDYAETGVCWNLTAPLDAVSEPEPVENAA